VGNASFPNSTAAGAIPIWLRLSGLRLCAGLQLRLCAGLQLRLRTGLQLLRLRTGLQLRAGLLRTAILLRLLRTLLTVGPSHPDHGEDGRNVLCLAKGPVPTRFAVAVRPAPLVRLLRLERSLPGAYLQAHALRLRGIQLPPSTNRAGAVLHYGMGRRIASRGSVG
jgi:hypothetical protein